MRRPIFLAGAFGLGLLLGAGSATLAAPADPQACAARGGRMEPRGMLQTPVCVIAYADAGKVCANKRDCAGKCIVQGAPPQGEGPFTGKCQPESVLFGCFAEIDRGRVVQGVCID